MEEDDRYTRITLRIPKDLHRSLSEAADSTSKSLNAEIVARLQDSFKVAGLGPSQHMDLLVVTVQSRAELIGMKVDLLKERLQGLLGRMRTISAEAELLARTAKTDADFLAAEEKAREIEDVKRDSNVLRAELEALVKERAHLLAQLSDIYDAATSKLEVLEPALAAFAERSRANPAGN